MTIRTVVDQLQSRGTYTFTQDTLRANGFEGLSMRRSLHRLQSSGRIVRVYRDFWVIVPLEHAQSGIVPPEWYIDALMHHVGIPYCIALLTAAAMHGAAHQQPQVFQVLAPRPLRPISAHGTEIQVHVRDMPPDVLIELNQTHTGRVRCTVPELTIVHLVAFMQQCGGIDNAFTVIGELSEQLNDARLMLAAQMERRTPVLQRLGWMLEMHGRHADAERIKQVLTSRTPRYVPLDSSEAGEGARNHRWRIIENRIPEADL